VLLENVVDYPNICKKEEFVFNKNIAGFVFVSESDYEHSGIHSKTAYYRLKNNTAEDGYDAMIEMFFCDSKAESHEMIKSFIDDYTMIEVYASNLKVGDLALGGIYRVDFVRGNIYMFVESYDDVAIDSLAKEIDLQILEIINNE